jgi:capsular polysaccharide biosynthesis protein
MELQQYFLIIRKRIPLIIMITLPFIILSGLYTRFVMKPMYAASTTILIGEDTSGIRNKQSSSTTYSDLLLYEKLVKTYQELAKSSTIAEQVIKNHNLDMLPRNITPMISTSSTNDSEIMSITVRSADPHLSMNIANETAKALKQKSMKLGMGDNISILDEALLPGGPYGPNLKRNVFIAFFIGLMLSIGIVFLIEYLDNTVKTQETAEDITGLPVIGIIPLLTKK